MSKYLSAIALSTLALAISSHAKAVQLSDDFQLIGTAAALSEYNMRGVSYTQRKPAIQASATVMHSSGAYVGVWASNFDVKGLDATYEFDYIGGYLIPFGDEVSLDVGYIKYTYPKSSFFNVSETYGVLSAYGFKLGVNYSSDYGIDQDDAALYAYLGYGNKTLLPWGLGFDVRFGITDLKDPTLTSSDGHMRDKYHEWELKLSKTVAGLDVSASLIDTNLSQSECLSFVGDKESCSARLLLGISKTF